VWQRLLRLDICCVSQARQHSQQDTDIHTESFLTESHMAEASSCTLGEGRSPFQAFHQIPELLPEPGSHGPAGAALAAGLPLAWHQTSHKHAPASSPAVQQTCRNQEAFEGIPSRLSICSILCGARQCRHGKGGTQPRATQRA